MKVKIGEDGVLHVSAESDKEWKELDEWYHKHDEEKGKACLGQHGSLSIGTR
jgi:hypothetical protein